MAESAKAAKAAGVRHFSLVTSKGANASIPASYWLPMHPLLYLRTKGQAEEAVKAQARWISLFNFTVTLFYANAPAALPAGLRPSL